MWDVPTLKMTALRLFETSTDTVSQSGRHTAESTSGLAWIHLAQDRVQWRSSLVKMAVKLRPRKRRVGGGGLLFS